jgi:hypothetical protein
VTLHQGDEDAGEIIPLARGVAARARLYAPSGGNVPSSRAPR